MTELEQRTLRWALRYWSNFCRARANEVAQDRNGKVGIPTSAVGDMLDEAKRAESLLPQFSGHNSDD